MTSWFIKDPRYRGNNISWAKYNPSIIQCINNYIDKWCNRHGYDKFVLKEGKYKLFINKADE